MLTISCSCVYSSGVSSTSDKNVNAQIRRSVGKVRQKIDWLHGRERSFALDYLIYCPDHRVVDVNAATLDMSRIIDSAREPSMRGRRKQR